MSKRFEKLKEDAVATAPKKDPNSLQDRQKAKAQTDKLANKKSNSAIPKNNGSVFSVKPEPNRGAGTDRHPNVPRNHTTRPMREDAAVMTAGGAGDPGQVQNPTTNYAAQKKKMQKIARRKKPVGEEFAAGISNTQRPAGSKNTPNSGKKKLSTFTKKKKSGGDNRVTAYPPSTSKGDTDTTPPMGGSSF